MLADNIMFLRKNYPRLYQALKKERKGIQKISLIMEATKNKDQTLKIIKDEKSLYLHSKYDPVREANAIIDQLEVEEIIDEKIHVIFYGLGLAYHVDVFVKRHPNIIFSFYEPSIEVFEQFLKYKNIKDYKEKKIFTIQCEITPESSNEFFTKILNDNNKKIVVVDLPSYQNAFKEERTRFFNRFIELVKGKRVSIGTDLVFQERWIVNSVVNFKEVLTTPNILMENRDVFKEKTGILVSAGPSLNDEIENLRLIKEKGSAYIFAVGSAINTLIINDILPDAMCSYDPSEENQLVFKKVNIENITSIPMIFGTSVGYETLQQYAGAKYHMITSQDTIAHYFLKKSDESEIKEVSDAASIAVVTLQLMNLLKFSTVILVGQNLGFKENKNYAQGIDYVQETIDLQNEKGLIKIQDVYGEEMFTTDSYNRMREQMEVYIKNFDFSVINTTKGGANIQGAQFILMEELIKTQLISEVVDENVFKKINNSQLYDKKYLKEKMRGMQNAFDVYTSLLSEMNQCLPKIKDLSNNLNVKQTNIMYAKLDRILIEIEANDFFKVIIRPMHRTEYEIIANKVQRLATEKNELKKVKQLLPEIETLNALLYLDKQLNQQIIAILSETVSNYCDLNDL